MPRDLPLGNGSLLVNFDAHYFLRDLYFPHIGSENHTGGHAFRFGVWLGGQFSWLDDPAWERTLVFREETMVTDVTLRHPGLGLELRCQDAVDFTENLFLRRVVARVTAGTTDSVRLFFHHDFHIFGWEVGDTAYYDPRSKGLVHYKSRRYFLCNGQIDGVIGVSQFATGTKETGAAQGTWRDAEDGDLQGNPIAQGAVDSTLALHLVIPPGGEAEAFYWIAVGTSIGAVRQIHEVVRAKGPQEILDRTASYWNLWVNKEHRNFGPLAPPLVDQFKRSLLVTRSQTDKNGAITAANDSDIMRFSRDTYSYVWPRDGALVANAMGLAGYRDLAGRFFGFCAEVITEDGYFLHKYNPNGSPASSWLPWYANGRAELPIQEDETALVIWSMWEHFAQYHDVELFQPVYRKLITRPAEFLLRYRDSSTGLPLPSWDLWEERRGVHAFTAAAVHAGLLAAANFAASFGEDRLQARFAAGAESIKAAVAEHLFDRERKRFVRSLLENPDGSLTPDPTLDASLFGLWRFGMFDPLDPRVVATMRAVRERLWIQTPIGGVARYENDYYQRVSDDVQKVAGNPWFICTLWFAEYAIAAAQNLGELDQALAILNWTAARALPSGVLAEQVHPYTGVPISVSPLTWSHATFVNAVMKYLERRAELMARPADLPAAGS
jgi:GH15 family glucan-1,4-alpha-glucosidase